MKAAEMMDADGKGKPLNSRIIKAIDEAINPYTHCMKPSHFIASQRDVFDSALQDATVSVSTLYPKRLINADPLKIEAMIIESFKNETFPMTQQGLVRAVAQAVAASVAEAQGADAGKAAEIAGKAVDGAIGYLNPGGTFYVIDTTKLPAGEKAWDMENALYANGYKERPMQEVQGAVPSCPFRQIIVTGPSSPDGASRPFRPLRLAISMFVFV